MKDEDLFVKKYGRVGSFDGYEVVGVLYEHEHNTLRRGWKIMAYQKDYGLANDYWVENGQFREKDVAPDEKASILKAIKTWDELEREKLLKESL